MPPLGRAQGVIPEKNAFGLHVCKALAGAAVLNVHSEGEAAFDAMGRGFPAHFVDVDIGLSKELTGEDD